MAARPAGQHNIPWHDDAPTCSCALIAKRNGRSTTDRPELPFTIDSAARPSRRLEMMRPSVLRAVPMCGH